MNNILLNVFLLSKLEDFDDVPVFDASPTEVNEWKELTLSGANVAYNPNDPRRQASPTPVRSAGRVHSLYKIVYSPGASLVWTPGPTGTPTTSTPGRYAMNR